MFPAQKHAAWEIFPAQEVETDCLRSPKRSDGWQRIDWRQGTMTDGVLRRRWRYSAGDVKACVYVGRIVHFGSLKLCARKIFSIFISQLTLSEGSPLSLETKGEGERETEGTWVATQGRQEMPRKPLSLDLIIGRGSLPVMVSVFMGPGQPVPSLTDSHTAM